MYYVAGAMIIMFSESEILCYSNSTIHFIGSAFYLMPLSWYYKVIRINLQINRTNSDAAYAALARPLPGKEVSLT